MKQALGLKTQQKTSNTIIWSRDYSKNFSQVQRLERDLLGNPASGRSHAVSATAGEPDGDAESASSPSEASAHSTARNSVSSTYAGSIASLGVDFDLSALEERVVEGLGRLNRVLVAELDVGKALRVTGELVAQNGHTVDGAAAVEVGFQLLGCRGVVHIADVDRPEVRVHAVLGTHWRSGTEWRAKV